MCIFGGIDVHARRLWLSHHLDLDSLNRLAAKLGFPLSATSMIPHDSRQLLLIPQRHIGLAAKLAYHFYLLQHRAIPAFLLDRISRGFTLILDTRSFTGFA